MANTESPMVTVGLVTHNRADLLARAIGSVLNQTYTNYELIVSDDNSSDHTAKVVRRYLGDHRIRYFKRPGIGMTQNFVETLKDARGEYFIWLCDDDYFSANYLEACLKYLSANPEYSLVCGVTRFTRDGVVTPRHEFLSLEYADPSERIVQYYRDVNSNIILYGLMRREEALRLTYPDTFCADLLWSSQVVFLGKVKILQEIQFYYSLNGISETTDSLQAYYRATRHKAVNPYYFLRKELVSLIFRKESVFEKLNYARKLALAARLWFVLRERFLMTRREANFRGALKIRTRVKALFR